MSKVKLEFLLAGGSFEAELPDGYVSEPQASAVVVGFEGARTVGYCPTGLLEPDRLDDFTHHYDIEIDGYKVSFYERPTSPLTYTAVWQLAGGVVETFMDEPTAYLEALESVVRRIKVIERPGRPPRLLLSRGVRRGETSEPSHRDVLQFVADDEVPTSRLLRFFEEPAPPRTSKGGVSRTDPEGHTVFRTLSAGVRVELYGRGKSTAELDEAIDEVAATVRAG